MEKVIRQISLLAATPSTLWREPHIKHFSLEKYSDFYELREKKQGPRPLDFHYQRWGYFTAHAIYQASAERHDEGAGAITQNTCGHPVQPGAHSRILTFKGGRKMKKGPIPGIAMAVMLVMAGIFILKRRTHGT